MLKALTAFLDSLRSRLHAVFSAAIRDTLTVGMCIMQWSAEERHIFNAQLLEELRQRGHEPKRYISRNVERRRAVRSSLSAPGAAAAREGGVAAQDPRDAQMCGAAGGQVPAGRRRAARLPGHALPALQRPALSQRAQHCGRLGQSGRQFSCVRR